MIMPGQEWRLPVTHQGNAHGVLILFGEDAHQGGAQQQQDQGVPELKDGQNPNVTRASGGSSLQPLGSSDLRVRPGLRSSLPRGPAQPIIPPL